MVSEGVFEGAADVAEIGRGAEQVAVGFEHIRRCDGQRCLRTTSTLDFGSVAPLTTASNISWQCGDGVWWMISNLLTSRTLCGVLVLGDGALHHLAGAGAVAGVVVGTGDAVGVAPVVGVGLPLGLDLGEQFVGGVAFDASRRAARQV